MKHREALGVGFMVPSLIHPTVSIAVFLAQQSCVASFHIEKA